MAVAAACILVAAIAGSLLQRLARFAAHDG